MRHIQLKGSSFVYSTNPFPAFRSSLIYGRNKRDFAFLPVKDVEPEITYRVNVRRPGFLGGEEVYVGTSKQDAQRVADEFFASLPEKDQNAVHEPWIIESPAQLPENKFRVIKTKAKGTILVVPGEDTTNRVLLMVGASGGFRGGVYLLPEGTTGQVLVSCSAANNCESGIDVVSLLEEGQTISFHSKGRRCDEVHHYALQKGEVVYTQYSWGEWRALKDVESSSLEDVESL